MREAAGRESESMKLEVIILAAGQGTRMKSALPKVLHPVAGRPLLQHVVDSAAQLAPSRLHIVVGHGAGQVREAIDAPAANWVEQREQLGRLPGYGRNKWLLRRQCEQPKP